MKLANPSDMKKIDSIAIEQYQVPGILLMDNAASHIAAKANVKLYGNTVKKIVVVAGKGNNGGDAFAAARYLYQWGYNVTVVSLIPRHNVTGDAEVFIRILENIGIKINYFYNENFSIILWETLADADLVIDGIFGTGIRGEVTGFFATAIEAINECAGQVLAIDIPSGINGETGQVCGAAVRADETVTFSLPKPGLYQYPGRGYAGNITVVDIGIPDGAIRQISLTGELLDSKNASKFLRNRPKEGHKGTFGKVLIITGSRGMTGAGALAAKAAFRTGSGLVYLAVPKSLSHIYNILVPEAITIPLNDDNGIITEDNIMNLLDASGKMDSVVIGPGLSAGPAVAAWVSDFVASCTKPLVIDADALNVLMPEIFTRRKWPAVITPHPGEFAALIGSTVSEIQKYRVANALQFSKKYFVTVVLKGAGTVIAYPDGRYFINTSGHSCLAVAGSGDVLAGITGSLIGQNVPHEQAAALAVYVHGRCGELIAGRMNGEAGITAGEITGEIPVVMSELRRLSVNGPTDKERKKC